MTACRLAAGRRTGPGVALAAAAVLALGGCAPTGPGAEAGGQSTSTTVPGGATGSSEEGTTCADIRAATGDLTDRIERGVNLIGEDPQGAVDELAGASDTLATLEAGASDSNLQRMLGDLRTKLDDLIAVVGDGVSLDEAGDLTTKASELSAAARDLSDYCQEY